MEARRVAVGRQEPSFKGVVLRQIDGFDQLINTCWHSRRPMLEHSCIWPA